MLPQQHRTTSFISEPCAHYGGRVDAEGKWGSQRNIGEVAIFLPIACDINKLFFSDIRMKADNESGREFNLGLGLRHLKNNGILGGYAYYDRRKSGLSNKLHTQMTFGVEWLGEDWEIRGNTYIPTTGEIISGANSGLLTNAQLIGSDVFIDEVSQLRVREEPMFGADVEVGAQVLDSGLWLFGGAFSFNGNDVASVEGVRTRARYEFNDYFALTAEGQYDSVRGRQGWLGFRVSVPFGTPQQEPKGLRRRMTLSPVRDVDIVTNTDVTSVGTDQTIHINNPNTGLPQRVLYVDNTAGGGGDGSYNNPYNTIAAADAAMQDNDIIYIRTGVGTAGYNTGFIINHNNIKVIGAGSALIYDGTQLTSGYGSNIKGTVIIPAGQKPTLTNPGGQGIYSQRANPHLSGFTVDGASTFGILIDANSINIGDVHVSNIETRNNGNTGIMVRTLGGSGVMDEIRLSDVTASNNTLQGVRIYASTGTDQMGNVYLHRITATGNSTNGVQIQTLQNATIGDVDMRNITATGNSQAGIDIRVSNAPVASSIGDITITNSNSSNNVTASGRGMLVTIANNSSLGSLTVNNSNFTNNASDGIQINNDSASSPVFNLSGSNRIFGNLNAMRLDLNGGSLQARGNWWGQAGGPAAGSIINENVCPSCGTADTSNSLNSDPRP